ncbi:MAG: hypothetical protein A2580_08640 [Hydrogenophilales bacterium RIFOXYD1_FULL_62_11]|nr:MAG: hypothetical protein A2580_08640 [Hydrogenophilales bacterium RIFOXYD1_FULL_62_11]
MRSLLIAAALLCSLPAHAAQIIIDTGHSPSSGGSTASDGTPEFKLNRAMAEQVISGLTARGHQVVDVHAQGLDRKLLDRTSPTRGADLFLSIHHDSVQQQFLDEGRAGEFAGFAVFISGKARKMEGTLKCAVHVGDAMVAAGEVPSRYHAAPIPGENRELLDDRRGIHRFDGLAVLRSAQSPALLLEVGVGVNPYEIGKLTNPEWIAGTAIHIVDGIERCLN